MPMVLIEDFEEYAAKHGGEYVKSRGWLLFGDGARCDEKFEIRHQPPSDPTELLKSRREYVQSRLRRAESNFRAVKNEVLEQAQLATSFANLPGPPPSAPQELRRLQAIVEQHRSDLAVIEAELDKTPEAQRQRRREADLQERQTAIAKLVDELESIEI